MTTSYDQNTYQELKIKVEPLEEKLLKEDIKITRVKWTRYLNILLLGLGFMFLFSSFATSQAYMTTIYGDKGYVILGMMHLVFSFSNFLSPMLDQKIGSRTCMIIASFVYCMFVLSVGCGVWWIVAIFSGVLGFSSALLWTSHGSFLTAIAEKDIGLFTGIFFSLQLTSLIIGNLLGSILIALKLELWKIYLILFFVGILGTITLSFLRPYEVQDPNQVFFKFIYS